MQSDNKLKLSFTKVSTFLNCRQKYAWEYIENLTTKDKSRALKIGDIVHQLLHLYLLKELDLEAIQDLNKVLDVVKASYTTEDDLLALEIASESSILVSGYLHEFANDPLDLLPGETILETDMGDYILTGRVDAWARSNDDQKLWRIEYKTTAKTDSHYLQGLKSGLQGAIYDFLSETLFKEELAGTIYNLIVKTKIPKYQRAFTRCNRSAIERMLKTVDGVYRDIQRNDLYPSSKCYSYASECPYKVLCEFDSPGTREAFFTRRKEVHIEPIVDSVD
jgi:CRISPR/Cas system-associated exonuclease Cas4 (RecB family)